MKARIALAMTLLAALPRAAVAQDKPWELVGEVVSIENGDGKPIKQANVTVRVREFLRSGRTDDQGVFVSTANPDLVQPLMDVGPLREVKRPLDARLGGAGFNGFNHRFLAHEQSEALEQNGFAHGAHEYFCTLSIFHVHGEFRGKGRCLQGQWFFFCSELVFHGYGFKCFLFYSIVASFR